MLCVARNDAERNNITFKVLDVVRQYALKIFKTAESGVDKVVSSCEKNPSVHWRYMNFLRQRKTALDAPLYAVSAGRSMIEMLGVLAIVGVLSVGGIAGYSKAMEQYKINKTISEYSMLMTGLLEYKDNFIKNSEKEKQINLGEFIFAAHLVPESWGLSNNIITDTNGNGMTAYFVKGRDERFVFDVRFARAKSNKSSFSTNLCVAFFKDIGKPLAYMMNAIFITSTQVEYAGEGHCHFGDTSVDGYPLRCLNDMTLSEMTDACQKCTEQACVIYFVF